MRGMCAAVLSFEGLILALMVPVMITVEDVGTSLALGLGLGLALVAFLLAGSLRRPAAYTVGHVFQLVLVACGVLVPIMFFIGPLFTLIWATAFLLGRRIEADKAARGA